MEMLSQAVRQRDSLSPEGSDNDVAAGSGAGGGAPITGRKSALLNQLNALTSDFIQRKDHHFAVQLRQLQEDLSRLHDSTHGGYLAEVADLRDVRDESLFIAREEGDARLKAARQEYEAELANADRDFEQSRQSLKGELVGYLQGKKRRLESDRSMLDIASSYSAAQANPHATRTQATTAGAGGAAGTAASANGVANGTTGGSGSIGGGDGKRTGSGNTPAGLGEEDPRKLRQRTAGAGSTHGLAGGSGGGGGNGAAGGGAADKYPSLARTEPSTQLDDMLTHLGDQIRQRKGYAGAGAEDRARDRIEREREKLVRTMLDGARNAEIEDDLALLRRRAVKKTKRR